MATDVMIEDEHGVSPVDPKTQPISWSYGYFRWAVRVLFSSAHRFYFDNGFSKAASLAYTSLFALVPITVLAFGLLSSFASSSEHLPQVRDFIIRQFVPDMTVVNDLLSYLAQFSQSLASLNILAIAFIVITSILLINSVEFALNEVWQVYEPRTLTNRIGIYCAVIVIAPVLAISAYYFARLRMSGLLQDVGAGSSLVLVYSTMLPFLVDLLAFVSLYYLVPKAPVRFRAALAGGMLAALLFGFAKTGFAYYIERFSSYDKVYGALASIPIFLFWLYLAWSIVLFGAETCFQFQYLPRSGKLRKRTAMSIGDGRLLIAMQSLILIARGYTRGTQPPNDLELSERLGVSSVVLKPTLDALAGAGIIGRGDSRAMPLMLLRSPETIRIEEVGDALGLSGTDCEVSCTAELRQFFDFLSTKNKAATLADLAKTGS